MMAQTTLPQIRGQLLYDEPMERHCSWRAGGKADTYYEPADKDDLANFLASEVGSNPITWVGLGSNLLVRNSGIRGITIGTLQKLNRLELQPDGRVYAEAGVTCAKFARFCIKQGLAGADFLAGIPGTVGGALAMNAGAFGFETWNLVDEVETISRQGQVSRRSREDFDIAYRSVRGIEDQCFSAGWFRLPEQNPDEASRVKELLEKRNRTQPIGQPSCGSVFMNPPGDYAARLIESCGLKGRCIGAACVSEKHANFIINTGGAEGNDIEDLIEQVRQTVADECGVELHHEVRIVGER